MNIARQMYDNGRKVGQVEGKIAELQALIKQHKDNQTLFDALSQLLDSSTDQLHDLEMDGAELNSLATAQEQEFQHLKHMFAEEL